jgi:DNA-binding NtrC family response regulator
MEIQKQEIVGAAYKQLISLVEKYAQEDRGVLFVGETGSGKERFAELYKKSSKRTGEKMSVNCAEYSDELLRSEVFGHVKGAFTNALKDRDGLLRTCDKGIAFLDELGDASTEFQAAILRVSEKHPFRPVGSDKEVSVDTLIIAATNRPTKIREDLKHRFQILPIPPLQKFDIPALAQHFLRKPIKREVIDDMVARDYPGNVRELKKLCERFLDEKKNSIFSEKQSHLVIETGTFDYERFRSEFLIWGKYISPILLKYGLNYSYKYFPSPTLPNIKNEDPNSLRIGQRMARSRTYYPKQPDPRRIESDLVRKLLIGKGDEKKLNEFITALDDHFSLRSLDVFLKGIDRYLGHNDQFQRIKPNLLPLLDLNRKEALREFEREYVNYHLEIHGQNRRETAEAIGIPKKTLDGMLRKLKKISSTKE